jgi:chaperonin cofactor prefoldin
VRVKEEQLDQLEAFDQQLVSELEEIKTALDALERATGDPVSLQTALSAAMQVVRATADLFAQRSKVITGI